MRQPSCVHIQLEAFTFWYHQCSHKTTESVISFLKIVKRKCKNIYTYICVILIKGYEGKHQKEQKEVMIQLCKCGTCTLSLYDALNKVAIKTIVTQLTHWGRVTHICVTKLTSIGSDNGLSPGRRQAIIWTNAGILLIGALGTNVSEILIKIYTFSLKKMHLKMSSGKRRPSCLGLNVLNTCHISREGSHLPKQHIHFKNN